MSDDLEQRLYQLVVERRAHADNRTCFDLVVESVEGSAEEDEKDILWSGYPILVREGMIHAVRAVEDYFGYRPKMSRGSIKEGIVSAASFMPEGIVTPNTLARFTFDQASRLPLVYALDILDFAAREVDDPSACARFISLASFLEQKKDYLRQSELEFHNTDYFIAASPIMRVKRMNLLERTHDNLLWQKELLHQTIKRAHEDMKMEDQYDTPQDVLMYKKLVQVTYDMEFPRNLSYSGPHTLTGESAALITDALRLEVAIDAVQLMVKDPVSWAGWFQQLQRARNELYSAQDDMTHALRDEQYEQAAVLRDKIVRLEQNLNEFD